MIRTEMIKLSRHKQEQDGHLPYNSENQEHIIVESMVPKMNIILLTLSGEGEGVEEKRTLCTLMKMETIIDGP
jgi:hypothetical protein